ncbi:MAG: putative sugar transporter, periplasmic component [candidate division NC10 bacterium]|nr:putative sugar transporter, periplasmic component [candidate division NC10 bacterium]
MITRICLRNIGRHAWLVIMLAILLAGCAGAPVDQGGASSNLNWKQFQGTTLRVLLVQSHWQQVIVKYIPDFEELTGIRLETEILTQEQLWNRLETDLKVSGKVDAFSVIPALDSLRLHRAGRLQPVNAYLADRALTGGGYQWDDFLPKFRAAMEVDGAVVGPPVMVEHLCLLYRKDLFKQHGLAVPRTLDELEAAARLLNKKPMGHQGAPGFGIVTRGQGQYLTGVYAGLLHAMGGTRRVLGNYAPPDVARYGWQEASSLFLDGRAGMYLDGSSIYPLIEESSNSRVSSQVGYAPFPAGPGGSAGVVAVRGLAIAKQSRHPQAAWLFLQWASGQAMVRKALMHGVLVARHSTWQDRIARSEVPEDLAQSLQDAGRTGVPAWAPPVVAITSGREIVGRVLTAAVKGEDVRGAATTGARSLRDLMATTERR